MSFITIKDRKIGDGYPAYIIAEMSANHSGSIERAKEIIRAAKESGADCIKIQTYTPDTLTIDCDNKYFQVGNGTWEGENLYKLYGKAYTPWEWQAELKAEADRVGIDFFSTPFDKTSVDFLEELGVEFYKIASFEMIDIPLIQYVASKGKPIIMSTGMATLEEIKEAVEADWGTEYLDYILSIKTVSGLDEAIAHINRYNTGHSEAIVTSDYANAQRFLDEIDAAAVYVNASTRFTDGGEFGFGAEIGISTQKLHARGPMGLKELTSTKYIIYGNGQVR